jgi:uncharacterized repeat protein (TIGR04138 family)
VGKEAQTLRQASLEEILRRDPRYPKEAYDFVFDALVYTQNKLEKLRKRQGATAAEGEHHVTGPQLLEGVRELALIQFGFLARTVFRLWNIHRTDDFGEIVFNLIDANHMSRRPTDRKEDFQNHYDLDRALTDEYVIAWEE